MTLPKIISWANPNLIGEWPKMMLEGLKLLGIKEIPGEKSNPEILLFAKEIGVSDIYKNDDTSWCALSHNAIAKRSGLPIGYVKDKYNLLRALAFRSYGTEIFKNEWSVVNPKEEMFGDTLIFQRPGGGHVGMYIAENDTHYYVMGGNQDNMYSITRISKNRLVAVRRPIYFKKFSSVKKYYLNSLGVPITSNES